MSLTASLPSDLETLADSLSACADELHERIMRALRQQQPLQGRMSQGVAQSLFENEVALRQQANSLYVDAANTSLAGFGVTQQQLLELAARARSTIRDIDALKGLAGIAADLLALAAAIASARPEHIRAPLRSLQQQLDAREQGGSA